MANDSFHPSALFPGRPGLSHFGVLQASKTTKHCTIRADQRAGGRVLLLSTSPLTPPPLPSRLASSTHPAVSRAIVLPLPRISHGTARPDCCCVFAAPHLHCVSWPHPNTGRSPVRPIAVVVYLIRPNRGLTAVLLGKSTTKLSRDFL